MKNLRKIFLDFLNVSDVKFFEPNDENASLIIPYYGLDKNTSINIYCDIINNLNLIKLGFISEINKEIDINTLKSGLLDLNSKIILGSLSLEAESNKIKYSIDYVIDDENDLTKAKYNNYIYQSLSVYSQLVKLKYIISKEN